MLFQTGPVDIEEIVDVDKVTAWDFVIAAVIMVIAVIVASVVKRTIRRQLSSLENMSDALSALLVRGVGYLILLVGVLLALPYFGFQIEPLMILLIIGGVLLFFAGRPLVEDFSAGLVLQTRSPFAVGDLIEHADHMGVVTDIDGRVTVILTPGGETVRIPNTSILKQPIVNLSTQGARRSIIGVRVAYGSDLDRVVEILASAVRDLPRVLKSPPPHIGVTGYGDSSIDLEVWVYHPPTLLDGFVATDEAIRSINRALEHEGIVVPFPQRDVWLRSEPDPETG